MRGALLKTLGHSTGPDQAPDSGLGECEKEGDDVNCGGGGGSGSDRAETLGGGARGHMDGDVRRESGYGYEPRRERFQSRWAPWGMSASEDRSRSRSPERRRRSRSPDRVFSTWTRDNGDEYDVRGLEDGAKELSPTPTAVVVADEPAFRVGAGLMNLGNTCFLNAVLQCLVHTSPLLQGLFMIKHYSPCLGEEFCVVCALREHVQRAFSSPDEIAPYSIANNLTYFSSDFVRYRQEDAHEFLQCLLDKLEKYPMCSLDLFSVTPSDNLVKQVFGGSLISMLRCSECNHISCTPEDLIDFSLEIDNVDTLEGALESFTKLEKIEDIKLMCDGCNGRVSMEKQFMIDKAPLVASFHLKRFKNDGIGVEKISKRIGYPLSLNLQPYTVGHPEHNQAELVYDLYAVIVHMGSSSNSGHYYCFVRSSPSMWHEFDDSMVTRVSESHVLSQEAYILFYAKQGTSWFSNVNEVQIHVSNFSPNSVLDNCNQSSESESSAENPYNCDIRANRHKDFSEATCQLLSFGSQQEIRAENTGLGKYSDLLLNGDGDDKNEMDLDESSFKFDMLLDHEDKENRKGAGDTNTSSFICDVKPSYRVRMNGNDEKGEATRVQPCTHSFLNNEKCTRSHSLTEAGNFPNKTTISPGGHLTISPSNVAFSSGSLGEGNNVTKKNTIISGGDLNKPSSCPTGLSGPPEDVKSEKPVLHKRSAEKPIDDPRKKQVIKNLRRTNMPLSRANKLLACMKVSPIKKKKPLVSPAKKHSPRSACRKTQNRDISPSVRSLTFR
uniref:Ubiquitin carboxyl-terminal hydrolase n=1 Tax=Kalanchoe fedtschenkoi TaxID=63787 RepID=A0A7N0U042_KALFE